MVRPDPIAHPAVHPLNPVRDSLNHDDFKALQTFLRDQSGITLADNKHYLVQSRLKPVLSETNCHTLGELIHGLIRATLPPRIRVRIMDAMTTNETFWFRDQAQFTLLQTRLLPELSRRRRFRTLRIWSAGCSTGQEPYSIAMCAHEALRSGNLPRAHLRIVGTDLSQSVLETAQTGSFSDLDLSRGLTESMKQRYFLADENGWKVKPEIAQLVKFQPFNLLKPFTVLGMFDLIFCRNVLIYFSPEIKRDILQRMAETLEPGGCLFLSSTETAHGVVEGLEQVCHAGVRYYRRPEKD